MSYNTNKGTSALAGALTGRMRDIMNQIPVSLDSGVIQDDYSLKTNNMKTPIPKGSYSLCRQLTLGPTNAHFTYTIEAGNPNDGTHDHGSSGTHEHSGGTHSGHSDGGVHTHSGDGAHVHKGEGPHIHDVLLPEKLRSPQPGDRVLVAWVQNEPIVVDIIVKS